MPRIAEAVRYDEQEAKRTSAFWGCWSCGFEDSYVRDVSKDTEHIRIRRRMCTRCGEMWETEERRIARGSFFARAEERRYAAFRKTRYRVRKCLVCGEHYLQSGYLAHTQESKAHQIEIARRQKRKRAKELRYRRNWARAKRAVAKLNRGTAICARCGGEYLQGTLRTEHSKTPRHQRVIASEHKQRRQERRALARASSTLSGSADRVRDKAA